MFQNKPKPFFDVLFDIIYDPYYAVFQQFDDIQNQFRNCTNDKAFHNAGNDTSYGEGRDYPRCSWLARLLFAVYAAFTCLLLVNLLIAIFNTTYQDVQADAEKTWSFNRVDIITEYIDKPFLPPPLIIMCHCYAIYKYIKLWYREQHCFEIQQDRDGNGEAVVTVVLVDTRVNSIEPLDKKINEIEKEGQEEYMNNPIDKKDRTEEISEHLREIGRDVGLSRRHQTGKLDLINENISRVLLSLNLLQHRMTEQEKKTIRYGTGDSIYRSRATNSNDDSE